MSWSQRTASFGSTLGSWPRGRREKWVIGIHLNCSWGNIDFRKQLNPQVSAAACSVWSIIAFSFVYSGVVQLNLKTFSLKFIASLTNTCQELNVNELCYLTPNLAVSITLFQGLRFFFQRLGGHIFSERVEGSSPVKFRVSNISLPVSWWIFMHLFVAERSWYFLQQPCIITHLLSVLWHMATIAFKVTRCHIEGDMSPTYPTTTPLHAFALFTILTFNIVLIPLICKTAF